MKTIEDLHTLVRLLAEFELLVSPILEYAIREKEEELSQGICSNADIEPKPKESRTKEPESPKVSTSKSLQLVVYREDGSVIQANNSTNTFLRAIKEIGVRRVYGLRMPMDGMWLVTEGKNPAYPYAQRNLGDDLFVNTHSNTGTKKRQLERIFRELGLAWCTELG